MKHLALASALLALSGTPAIAQSLPAVAGVERSVPTPFVIGAVEIKPAELVVASAPVRRGQPVLSGVAEHAETAATTEPMVISHSVFMKDHIASGAVLHATEFVDTRRDVTRVYRTWCSDFGKRGFIGGGVTFCFLEGDPLRRTWATEHPKPWISVSPMFASQVPGRADVFAIAPSATDLIGPMDIRFEVARIRRQDVRVTLKARRDRQDMTVVSIDLPLRDGVAALPLWSHTLSLTVAGDGVTPALHADGDGTGPMTLPGVNYPPGE